VPRPPRTGPARPSTTRATPSQHIRSLPPRTPQSASGQHGPGLTSNPGTVPVTLALLGSGLTSARHNPGSLCPAHPENPRPTRPEPTSSPAQAGPASAQQRGTARQRSLLDITSSPRQNPSSQQRSPGDGFNARDECGDGHGAAREGLVRQGPSAAAMASSATVTMGDARWHLTVRAAIVRALSYAFTQPSPHEPTAHRVSRETSARARHRGDEGGDGATAGMAPPRGCTPPRG
jgi:hypothetical protein